MGDVLEVLRGLGGRGFKVILADPPWMGSNQGSRASPAYSGEQRAQAHYTTMTMGELRGLPVEAMAAPDALLFLWRVACMQEEACAVAWQWGFEVASEIVWCKTTTDGSRPKIGLGNYWRNAHEVCLLATRGRATRLIKDHGVPSYFEAPVRQHSQKPIELYDRIDRLTGRAGPRIELFATESRPGWWCWGLGINGYVMPPAVRRKTRVGD